MKRVIKKIIPEQLLQLRRDLVGSGKRIAEIQQKLDEINSHLQSRDSRLDTLRQKLQHVEHYQPTYGISGVIESSARSESYDRARLIEGHFKSMPGKRVLDIGSSLGFFSFYFSDRGASVEGWESNIDNCEAARAIADINGIPVDFKTKELNETTVGTIQPGRFDAVLVLSVFHHIIRFQGLEETKVIVKEIFDRVPVMVVELAKKGEDPKLPWDKYQPEDELEIFDLVKDEVTIKKIGEFPNHLSSNLRPLYIVEKKKNIKVGGRIYAYDEVRTLAYKESPVGYMGVGRKYFFSEEYVVKDYSLDKSSAKENTCQILDEISFLLRIKELNIYHTPEIIDFDIQSGHRAQLVQKRYKGSLLSDVTTPIPMKAAKKLLKDLLRTLSDLEGHGYYHNDIRSWNTIINKSSAWLIDYGLISKTEKENNIVALLWVANKVLTGQTESSKYAKKKLPPKKSFEVDESLRALYEAAESKKTTLTDLYRILGGGDHR